MKIADFLTPQAVLPALSSVRKDEVLAELADFLVARHAAEVPVDAATLCRVLAEREELGSTAIGEGVAIPHGKIDGLGRLLGVLGRAPRGLDFGAADGKKTHLIFVLAVPAQAAGLHLQALARVSRLCRSEGARQRLLDAADAAAIYAAILDEDSRL